MKIKVTVQGDPDIRPIEKMYEYTKSDEFIFFDSIEEIKKRISNNIQLNFDDVLRLFVAFVMISIRDGQSFDKIKKNMSKLIQPHQVLIGVPESMRKITYDVLTEDGSYKIINVTNPILINQYIFKPQSLIRGKS